MAEDTKYMTADELDMIEDTQFVDVHVPEWKRTLRFGSLTANDMLNWVDANDGPAKKTAGLRLIIDSMVDGDGNRIGNDKMINSLKRRNADVIRRLVEEVLKLNGMNIDRDKEKNASSEASIGASPTVLH